MGIDYSDLNDIPGTIPKPKKREKKPKGMERRARLNPVNRKRRDERNEVAYGKQAEACRKIGVCCACGKERPTDPHHVKSRGAGGDDSVTVPLCRECHQRSHAMGQTTFWIEVGIDPYEVIAGMQAWMAAGFPRNQMPVIRR